MSKAKRDSEARARQERNIQRDNILRVAALNAAVEHCKKHGGVAPTKLAGQMYEFLTGRLDRSETSASS